MRKCKMLLVMIAICMFLSACQKGNDTSNSENTNMTNGESGVESDAEGEMEGLVWFPKSAKAYFEDGTLKAAIETELSDSTLTYRYVTYSKMGDDIVGRYNGFEIEYENDVISKYREIRGIQSGDEVTNHTGIEMAIEYDDSTDTIYVKELDAETGEVEYAKAVSFKFDADGKVIERVSNFYYYDDQGNAVTQNNSTEVYTYEYSESGYYITNSYIVEDKKLTSGNAEECIKEETTFIPFDKDKEHTVTTAYYTKSGEIAILAETNDYDTFCQNNVKTEFVYNNKGYLIEIKSHLVDETVVIQDIGSISTFDDDGNILSYVEKDAENINGEFIYDKNGNISKLTMGVDGQKYTVEIEWMLVPECIDIANQINYGSDKYAIASLIKNAIPKNDFYDIKELCYTREMIETLIER